MIQPTFGVRVKLRQVVAPALTTTFGTACELNRGAVAVTVYVCAERLIEYAPALVVVSARFPGVAMTWAPAIGLPEVSLTVPWSVPRLDGGVVTFTYTGLAVNTGALYPSDTLTRTVQFPGTVQMWPYVLVGFAAVPWVTVELLSPHVQVQFSRSVASASEEVADKVRFTPVYVLGYRDPVMTGGVVGWLAAGATQLRQFRSNHSGFAPQYAFI